MSKEPPTVVLTSTQMAGLLGIDRSTLVRLEQRRIIPMAPLAPKSHAVQGRLYDQELVRQVKAAYAAHEQRSRAGTDGRPKPPKAFVVSERA